MGITNRSISLQLIVAISISISLLILTGLLTLLAYRGMESGIRSATETTAKYINDTVSLNIRLKIIPLYNTLKYLNFDEIATAKTLEERKEAMPLFVQTLNSNPISSAVFIGYATGEMLMLNKASYTYTDFPLGPTPNETSFILQSKTLQADGTFYAELCFYNDTGNILECKQIKEFAIKPTTRPWYKNAMANDDVVITPPYLFYASNDVGITIAGKTHKGDAVFGLDATTKDLNELLDNMLITPHTKALLINQEKKVVGYSKTVLYDMRKKDDLKLADVSKLDMPVFDFLASRQKHENIILPFRDETGSWFGLDSTINAPSGSSYTILLAIPSSELLANARRTSYQQALAAGLIVMLMLFIGWRFGKYVVRPLHSLAKQVQSFSEFNFSSPIDITTHVKEVRELGFVLRNMSQTIINFLNISLTLNKEQNLETMLQSVLDQLMSTVHLKEGAIFLYKDKEQVLALAASHGLGFPSLVSVAASDISDDELKTYIATKANIKGILVPLRNREKELVGLLCFACSEEEKISLGTSFLQFVDTLSASAAIAIETRQLIHAQKALLSGVIKIIADAIDAKSHYTGGHCQRVPLLAQMILDELGHSAHSPFPGFTLTKHQEDEFRIAAWLHDCGKITTPEYVVDKATKLETIYNRIHEIRTRFEVLYRDITIQYLKACLDGQNPAQAAIERDKSYAELIEEFAFVGKCNIGGEFMTDDDIAKLKIIAQKPWLRHFSLAIGLSRDELLRLPTDEANEILPVKETLLADKPIHIMPWVADPPPVQPGDLHNKWGFDMALPKYMYNYGEIYNLSIRKGTLTTEERFKINEHIVQTISMLKSLPLPSYLKRVPDIAGNHHEKMDGTGYPRKLHSSQMDVGERVMAIADVFEALTAADRPYKEGKKLSEALLILTKMGKEGHLDPILVNFFLQARLFEKYAQKHLAKGQRDEINIEDYLIDTSHLNYSAS